MKNAAPPVGLKLTAFVAMSSVHRAIHLLHGGWRNWQKLAGFYCYDIELLAMCYYLCWFWFGWLVGLSPSDITCRPFGRQICYNVMNIQLSIWPILAVWLRPTTNHKQHTNQIHTACSKVSGFESRCNQFFHIWMFNLGIAYGAKVGLKHRLCVA